MTSQTTSENDEVLIACRLSARDLASRREEITQQLFSHVEAREELPDGFGFRFPSVEPWASLALEFIQTERQCCPFFRFEMVFLPNDGPFWLRLGGSPEIKAFIMTELGLDGGAQSTR